MNWTSIETLTSAGGLVAAVATAIAGFLRFRAWWQDRARQAKIEAATYLKEKGSADWQREFGEEEMTRVSFAGLTGIDRATGHDAIRRCQQRLGNSTRAWDLLRGVGNFLVATGHIARVRKPQRRDHVGAAIAFLASVVLVGISAMIIAASTQFLTKADWATLRIRDVLIVVVLAIPWAANCALFAGAAARHWFYYMNACTLYRNLVKLGKARRKNAARPRTALAVG